MESDVGWIGTVNDLAVINDRIGRFIIDSVSIDDEGATHIEGTSQRDGARLIITVPSLEAQRADGRTSPPAPDGLEPDGIPGSMTWCAATPDGVLRCWHRDGSVWSSVERDGYADLWGISEQDERGHFVEWAEGAPSFVELIRGAPTRSPATPPGW